MNIIEDLFQQTGNEEDRIVKREFIEMYQKHYNLNSVNWANLLNDVKRLGIEYNRTLRKGAAKGSIIGLKLVQKPHEEDEVEDAAKLDKTVRNVPPDAPSLMMRFTPVLLMKYRQKPAKRTKVKTKLR